MSVAADAVTDTDSPEPGERVWWSGALWTVTERDGALAHVERVGTLPPVGCRALWLSASLLEIAPCERGQC